jgi:aryl-alcohol dehydrogenase-like predicted oxidoreductase
MAIQTVMLGKTDIEISALGLGAWAWGDKLFWSYGQGYSDNDIRAAYEVSLAAGGQFCRYRRDVWLGAFRTPVGRVPGQRPLGAGVHQVHAAALAPAGRSLLKALRRSLERLGVAKVDLYQVHWPSPPRPVEVWADAMADAVQAGLTRAVGVSNYSEDQMRKAYATLTRRGVTLASNQVPYSLLDRRVERNGLLQVCKDLNITLIAYSPLAQGVLTGKYSPERPLPGIRGRRWNRALLRRVQPLLKRLRELGDEHGGKSISQVALNWAICKGTVPIPGAKNARQAEENAGALGWSLTESEVAELDQLSQEF